MKINLTKRQYRYLVEICLLGAYMIEQSKIIEDSDYNNFLKYILSFSNDFKFEIDGDLLQGVEQIASTTIKEIEFKEDFVGSYNEKVFWKELASRLASKDALHQLGDEITEFNYASYVDLKNTLEEKYLERFELSHYDNNELPY
ncbi:hypothetical protein CPJCM30710_21150 [Clostridium polyendosporum]|uniref:Uncharacterized protein n=1 Tax=Clostridium polyendosporum TaxID=69208 RepID=A0A919S109_9CLOT|nr:hypothetical protein [Clostridium polyendosporum]GIM29449.1 hypothetical protein CPJCM30710_21150 [Clostridium polyendosporum]